jgi:hypothetical protein
MIKDIRDACEKVKSQLMWITTDDHHYSSQEEALDHQERIDFLEWCAGNICCGGEWSSDMVAKAILEDWIMRPCPKPEPDTSSLPTRRKACRS